MAEATGWCLWAACWHGIFIFMPLSGPCCWVRLPAVIAAHKPRVALAVRHQKPAQCREEWLPCRSSIATQSVGLCPGPAPSWLCNTADRLTARKAFRAASDQSDKEYHNLPGKPCSTSSRRRSSVMLSCSSSSQARGWLGGQRPVCWAFCRQRKPNFGTKARHPLWSDAGHTLAQPLLGSSTSL